MDKRSTEQRNPNTMELDLMTPLEIAEVMNREDEKTVAAVKKVLSQAAEAISVVAHAFENGGRLFYLGAGTSGRLGVLDASECPPTFGVPAERVIGLIAGGQKAILSAVENAEDSNNAAEEDLQEYGLNAADVVCGIAASGSTPYVIGGLKYAASIGCTTISLACVNDSLIGEYADIKIEAVPGPEILTGSTRLKAGTTTKMILNMITTGAMVKTGRCYENLMVDVMATNEKLRKRSVRIVSEAVGVDEDTAAEALKAAGGSAKTAIVMLLCKKDKAEAEALLSKADGHIRNIDFRTDD